MMRVIHIVLGFAVATWASSCSQKITGTVSESNTTFTNGSTTSTQVTTAGSENHTETRAADDMPAGSSQSNATNLSDPGSATLPAGAIITTGQ